MMTYIFILIAAIFNAIMDTLWTKYNQSIFKGLNPNWWNPNESWKHMSNWMGWVRFDAWHIAKFGMIGCITLSIVSYNTFSIYDIVLIPSIWSFSFELFYSKILKSK
jgi:hypothetical protein